MYLKPTPIYPSYYTKAQVNNMKLPSFSQIEEILKKAIPTTEKNEEIANIEISQSLSFKGLSTVKEVAIQKSDCVKINDCSAFTQVSDSFTKVNIQDKKLMDSIQLPIDSFNQLSMNENMQKAQFDNKDEPQLIKIDLSDAENHSSTNEEFEKVAPKDAKLVVKTSIQKTQKERDYFWRTTDIFSGLTETGTRRDVVYQTIFRYLRKFYQFMYQRFTKVKGAKVDAKQHLKLFSEYLIQSFKISDVKTKDLMIHIGSIIYPANINQLEQKLSTLSSDNGSKKAQWKVALSILKYREVIQKFNLNRMTDFFMDHIYGHLFNIYSMSIMSGRFEMPEVMQKNKELYLKTFEGITKDINSARTA